MWQPGNEQYCGLVTFFVVHRTLLLFFLCVPSELLLDDITTGVNGISSGCCISQDDGVSSITGLTPSSVPSPAADNSIRGFLPVLSLTVVVI